jgi:hypothetical protein
MLSHQELLNLQIFIDEPDHSAHLLYQTVFGLPENFKSELKSMLREIYELRTRKRISISAFKVKCILHTE